MDKATTIELIVFVLESLNLIKKRFATIHSSDDFLVDDSGLEKLDSISMRLQSIGEEAVFDICKNELDDLEKKVLKLHVLLEQNK